MTECSNTCNRLRAVLGPEQWSVLAIVTTIMPIVLSPLQHDIIYSLIIHCLARETNLGIRHNW